jgi:xanthine dehydrogenase accessory factor
MNNIYLQIPLRKPDISELVLATVTSTTGSTPQKPGSSALFNRHKLVAGTVGGGILECKVQQIAMESVTTKKSGHYLFRLDNRVESGEDALCGGKISVLVDSGLERHLDALEALQKSSASRIPGVLVTVISKLNGDEVNIKRYWSTNSSESHNIPEIEPGIRSELSSMISSSDHSDFRKIELTAGEEPETLVFLESVIPQPRLYIAGAGHIGKALAQIAAMLDFEITVIDDRPEFANPENIPFADHIITDDIGKAISRIEKGPDTYFVIVTRGHRDDGKVLKECIGSDAAYVGMIGSRNKTNMMRKEFIEKGWASQDQWDRIFAPIGLEIRSQTVGEIAVSIAAQLVQVRNAKGA